MHWLNTMKGFSTLSSSTILKLCPRNYLSQSHGEEGHLIEVEQSGRLIRHNAADDKGRKLNRCHHDLRSFVMARSQLTRRKVFSSWSNWS